MPAPVVGKSRCYNVRFALVIIVKALAHWHADLPV